jgi:mRNA-degrading endonuclease RelE of RelBE toxin-antitoxin system
MIWACELTADAQKDLRRLSSPVQKRVARTIDQMAVDPFQGNVKCLKGPEWLGVFRRRMGSYRILFTVDHKKHTFFIVRILIRSKGTYQ